MSIVNTIYQQLGGIKFCLYTGCKDFYNKENHILGMTIPKNKSKANRLEVIYNYATDTYNMRFFRHTNARFSQKKYIETGEGYIEAKDTELEIFEDVYCDQLIEIFEHFTSIVVPFRMVFSFN